MRRSPEQSSQDFVPTLSDRERQNNIYQEQGVTVEKAAEIPSLVQSKENKSAIDGELSFYLNSSDSLRGLYQVAHVEGQRVLTVGGSGDFAQIFISKGAKQVDVLDYSLPACFWNELKLIAAKHLAYEDFYKLFATIEQSIAHPRRKGVNAPIFDSEMYTTIKEHLSPQAQAFFDTLQKKEFSDLFKFNFADPYFVHHNGMVRFRSPARGFAKGNTDEPEKNNLINQTPILQNRQAYNDLHKNIQTVEWNVRPGNLEDRESKLSGYDFVYASNISYYDMVRNAASILKRGVKRVGFTMHGSNLSESNRDEYQKRMDEALKGKPDGLHVINKPIKLQYSTERGIKYLKATLVTQDTHRDYLYYLEARAEDNKK